MFLCAEDVQGTRSEPWSPPRMRSKPSLLSARQGLHLHVGNGRIGQVTGGECKGMHMPGHTPDQVTKRVVSISCFYINYNMVSLICSQMCCKFHVLLFLLTHVCDLENTCLCLVLPCIKNNLIDYYIFSIIQYNI
jgi:hypothetical protein